MEEWMDIKGFEGLYAISNLGAIKSLARESFTPRGGKWIRKEKFLSTCLTTTGYPHTTLWKNGLPYTFMVHRLVAIHFVHNPDNKPEINHVDGIKTNPVWSNLEWCTSSENHNHAFRTGLRKTLLEQIQKMIAANSGASHYLTKKIINTKTGKVYETQKEAAQDLGITQPLVSNYLSGKIRNKTPLKYL